MADQNNAPERIWHHSDGAYLSCQPAMHWEWQEYVRKDLARADRAAPEGQVQALMRSAFRVTEAWGPRHFAMVFKFPSLDELQAADKEWRAALTPPPPPTPSRL